MPGDVSSGSLPSGSFPPGKTPGGGFPLGNFRALAGTVVALALGAPATAAAQAADPLERFVPVVVHDSRDDSPLTSVEAFAGTVPGVPAGAPEPTVYGRRAGRWLQYWMLFERNDQDRGVVRTGRHAGDWELVQYAIGDDGLVRGVYSQHSGAERCPAGAIRTTPRERPLVYLAVGSHAAYFRPGVRDRMWPDPNDHADGRGLRVRPRLVRISARRAAVDAVPRPLGRRPRELGPGRDGLAARARLPARRPLERPGRLGPRRALVHARGLRPDRRVRPAGDRAGRRRRRGRGAARADLRLAPLAPCARAGGGYAAARWPLRCQGFRIRGPSAVTATVNSKCAASEPSWE